MLRRRRFSPNGRGSDALTGLFERRGGVGFPQRRSGGAALRAWVQTLRRRFLRNGDRGFDAQGSPKRRSGVRRARFAEKAVVFFAQDASKEGSRRFPNSARFSSLFLFVAFAPFLGRSFSGDFFTADAQQKPANRFADFKRRDATREKKRARVCRTRGDFLLFFRRCLWVLFWSRRFRSTFFHCRRR